MTTEKKQILLTNDDGIESPGLWAAAEALSSLGYVTVVAPTIQFSGAGRSHPLHTDGSIRPQQLQIGSQIWTVLAISGSPAQAVMYAVLDLLPRKPDLVVSGINYGENVGSDILISGTVGAALEGAAFGIPSMAVSLQLANDGYLTNSREVDFLAAAHFLQLFAGRMLNKSLPPDVNILKVDVPTGANPETPWRVARMSTRRYYIPSSRRRGMEGPGDVHYTPDASLLGESTDTDSYTLAKGRNVAVTPISLDMTSRVSLQDLENFLRN